MDGGPGRSGCRTWPINKSPAPAEVSTLLSCREVSGTTTSNGEDRPPIVNVIRLSGSIATVISVQVLRGTTSVEATLFPPELSITDTCHQVPLSIQAKEQASLIQDRQLVPGICVELKPAHNGLICWILERIEMFAMKGARVPVEQQSIAHWAMHRINRSSDTSAFAANLFNDVVREP